MVSFSRSFKETSHVCRTLNEGEGNPGRRMNEVRLASHSGRRLPGRSSRDKYLRLIKYACASTIRQSLQRGASSA